MAWDPPSDAELAPGKPGKPSLARRIRDLSPALAERASGAPWLNAAAEEVVIKDFGRIRGHGLNLVGSWTVPEDVYWIHVLACGGGGSGGEGASGGNGIGGGGGAGGICRRTFPVTPGQEIPVTIGAGGNTRGVDSSVDTTLDGFVMGDGARTTVGTPPYHVVALGGKCGGSGLLGAAGGAGAPGDPYVVVIDGVETVVPRIPGARGHAGVFTLVSLTLVTRSGQGADSFLGGGGRAKFSPLPDSDFDGGSAPGAGGGGGISTSGSTKRQGGVGANGIVIIRY